MARWVIKDVDEEKAKAISRKYDIPLLAAEIILRRQIENLDEFLNPSEDLVGDPFLLKDMKKAVDVLIGAWKKKEKILIHGDYDVDGITGAALLYTFMKSRGWDVQVYIPDRMSDGYGISPQAVEEFASKGFTVLLTVDCGTTAYESVELAKKLGMRVVITDHHEVMEKLPPADALVNPHRPDDPYPFKELAGVGVGYKLVQALGNVFGLELDDLRDLLDLVALGTVADMVPLVGENRYYVKEGLRKIGKVRHGLRKLVEKLSLSEVRSRDISYKIAPRLNAAGRMGSAYDAFKLLVAEDEEEAEKMAEALFGHNLLRQAIENDIFKEALNMVMENELYKNPVIVVGGENWHIGVIGIVASKIANKFKKPAIVVSFSNGVGKGSARSVNGVSVMEIFQELKDLFVEFGGHSMAVGFTIEKSGFEDLKKKVASLSVERQEEVIDVDAVIDMEDVNPSLFEVIDLFEPFGLGNPPLTFLIKDMNIQKASFFDGGNSVNLTLRKKGRKITAVWMGLDPDHSLLIKQGTVKIDVIGEIEPDFFSPKLKIFDARFRSGVEEMDSLVIGRVEERIDKEELMVKRKASELLWDEFSGGVVFSDIRARNAVLRRLMAKGSVFVGCCLQIVESVYRSLLRHAEIRREKFLTIREFLERGSADSLVVLIEPQILMKLRGIGIVEDFIKEIAKIDNKFAVGTRIPKGIKSLLKDMRFKKLRAKFHKEEMRIQDMRGKNYKPAYGNFVIVADDPEQFSSLTDGQIYSHALNRFQRASMVNLIKRGSVRRFSSTPSSDGLPTFLRNGEISFLSYPTTPYELLDSIYPTLDGTSLTFILAYDIEPKEYDGEIEKTYEREINEKVASSQVREILKILQDHEVII